MNIMDCAMDSDIELMIHECTNILHWFHWLYKELKVLVIGVRYHQWTQVSAYLQVLFASNKPKNVNSHHWVSKIHKLMKDHHSDEQLNSLTNQFSNLHFEGFGFKEEAWMRKWCTLRSRSFDTMLRKQKIYGKLHGRNLKIERRREYLIMQLEDYIVIIYYIWVI